MSRPALATLRPLAVHVAVRTGALRIANYVVGFAVSLVISRALGPMGRGEYYLPILTANTLVLLFHFSIEHANIYLLSEKKASLRQLTGQATTIAFVGGIVAVLLSVVFFLLKTGVTSDLPLNLLLAALVPVPLLIHQVYISGLLVVSGAVVAVQRRVLLSGGAQAVMLAVLWLYGAISPLSVILAADITAILGWSLLLSLIRQTTSTAPIWDPALVRESLSFGLKMHTGAIFVFLNLRADAYLVKSYAGLMALGYYSLAATLVETIWLATDSVAMVVLQRQTESDLPSSALLTARVCRVNFAIAGLLAGALAISIYPIIRYGYGANFMPTVIPVLILLPGIVVSSQWRPLGGYLIKLGRPAMISVINAAGVVLNIGLNVALIPLINIKGAALSTTLSYSFVTVLYGAWFLRSSSTRFVDLFRIRPSDVGWFQPTIPTSRP